MSKCDCTAYCGQYLRHGHCAAYPAKVAQAAAGDERQDIGGHLRAAAEANVKQQANDARHAALEEAAQLCELWNTTPGRSLAKEIRALANVQPKGMPFLARDVAELLGIGVPELSAALVALGFPQRSQGMTIDPREALAVCRARAAQAPAPAPEPLHLGACLTDGKLHATVMRREPNGHITVVAAAEIAESMLRASDVHAVMTPAFGSLQSEALDKLRKALGFEKLPSVTDAMRCAADRIAWGLRERDKLRAELESMRAERESQAPAVTHEPNDWRLPADLKTGHVTFRKGVHCSALVSRMKMLHETAFGVDNLTPEQKAENLAALQACKEPPHHFDPPPHVAVMREARALSDFFWDNNLGHVPAHLVANLREALAASKPPVQPTGGA